MQHLCISATHAAQAPSLSLHCSDLVFAAFLLNYADSYSMLAAFVRTIHQALRDGGRFVSVNGARCGVVWCGVIRCHVL